MQPTTPRDFLKVVLQRLTAAEEIMDKLRLTLEAQYIGGYSVECSFKALILEKTPEAERPAEERLFAVVMRVPHSSHRDQNKTCPVRWQGKERGPKKYAGRSRSTGSDPRTQTRFQPPRSVASSVAARSVNADGLQLVAPGVRDRGFPAVSQHDRRAVGGVEREQF